MRAIYEIIHILLYDIVDILFSHLEAYMVESVLWSYILFIIIIIISLMTECSITQMFVKLLEHLLSYSNTKSFAYF